MNTAPKLKAILAKITPPAPQEYFETDLQEELKDIAAGTAALAEKVDAATATHSENLAAALSGNCSAPKGTLKAIAASAAEIAPLAIEALNVAHANHELHGRVLSLHRVASERFADLERKQSEKLDQRLKKDVPNDAARHQAVRSDETRRTYDEQSKLCFQRSTDTRLRDESRIALESVRTLLESILAT